MSTNAGVRLIHHYCEELWRCKTDREDGCRCKTDCVVTTNIGIRLTARTDCDD